MHARIHVRLSFVRCQSAVSYPAPTYYAHLAADRGRKLICQVMADQEKKLAKRKVCRDGGVSYYIILYIIL